jgi:hypothetical protein
MSPDDTDPQQKLVLVVRDARWRSLLNQRAAQVVRQSAFMSD